MTYIQAARRNGFTLVELIIVIVGISILLTVTMVGWGSWQQNIAKKSVDSDVRQAYTAMENAKNFSTSGYPTSLPSNFNPSSGTTITYVSGNTLGYCLEGVSAKYPTVVYSISSVSKTSTAGSCGGEFAVAAPSPTISSITGYSMVVSWANVPQATSYSVKYGTASPTTTASCTASPCTISGLTANTNYKINVTASSAYDSTTSATINATTTASAPVSTPSTPNVAMTASTSYGTVAASGGTCSVGTTEWQLLIYASGSATAPTPDWSTTNWGTVTSRKILTNGSVGGTIYYHGFARPRCTDGTQSVVYSSYAYGMADTSGGGAY